jgi:ATP synthase protein I
MRLESWFGRLSIVTQRWYDFYGLLQFSQLSGLSSKPVNSPENPQETAPPIEVTPATVLPPDPSASMQEYYRLQNDLLKSTLIISAVIFACVWGFYSLNIALNYLIGAGTGVVYLKMLARNVEQLGRGKKQVGKTQLATLVVVIVVASRLDQLQILPIFLGFLTYKAAVIFYMLRTTLMPDSG